MRKLKDPCMTSGPGKQLRLATEARRISLDNFNKAIRDAYQSGLKQWQIAEVVGLTQARVSQIVNETPMPLS